VDPYRIEKQKFSSRANFVTISYKPILEYSAKFCNLKMPAECRFHDFALRIPGFCVVTSVLRSKLLEPFADWNLTSLFQVILFRILDQLCETFKMRLPQPVWLWLNKLYTWGLPIFTHHFRKSRTVHMDWLALHPYSFVWWMPRVCPYHYLKDSWTFHYQEILRE